MTHTLLLKLVVSAFLVPGASTRAHAESPIPQETITLEQLVNLSDADLAQIDIAAMNLAVAEGLPGSKNLDRTALLKQLDMWANYVAYETLRHRYRFQRNPEEYNNSYADFCMLMLTNTLQQAFGVRYNPDQITPPDDATGFDFTRSQDLFINGLLQGTGGTCTSMPVLYIAVGRRLGYPLKLATSPSHSFLRWDHPLTGERFNIEGTAFGFLTPTDEELANLPRRGAMKEFENSNYLESLSPREELAVFLTTRGDCLESSGRTFEADYWYRKATKLAPRNPTARLGAQLTGRKIVRWREVQELEAAVARHERQMQANPPVGMPRVPMPVAHPMSVRRSARPPLPGFSAASPVRPSATFPQVPWLPKPIDPMVGVPEAWRQMSSEAAALQEEILRGGNPWNFVKQPGLASPPRPPQRGVRP